MSHITAIGTANPGKKVSQSVIAEFMVRAMRLGDSDARKLRAVFRAAGIETRYSTIADYGKLTEFEFYSNEENFLPFPSTRVRMEWFRRSSLKLSLEAIEKCLLQRPGFDKMELTHLIVVSCTGMSAPGLDIDLVKGLGLPSNIQRLCINFMGCYAAFNALRLADTFCNHQQKSKVLVVCTELCSLHFQKDNTEDNLLANALFADGSAAVLVESEFCPGINLIPKSFCCDLAPEGAEDMAWQVGDLGFEMKLSSYVPDVIRRGIRQLTDKLLEQISLELSNVDYFAIHPGGRKILEAIEAELGLNKDQNQHAYQVLSQYGNMSSPTVLFVLNSLAQAFSEKDHGKSILSFAFGPGLTLESMLLKIENH